jgi:putative glutamine amidotransferase
MKHARSHGERPRIGITVHVDGDEYRSRTAYADAVANVGAIPILLPCSTDSIPEYLSCCDAFVTTGGDDPNMEAFGESTHEKANPLDPLRQEFELELLRHLEETDHPLLAICLGMQLMTLAAGGTLDQYLPETLPTAELHWNGREHPVEGAIGSGTVHSHHRQAMSDAGRLEIVARAPDGVIEAVQDPERAYRIGVQWHPERTAEETLGVLLFEQLARASRHGAGA